MNRNKKKHEDYLFWQNKIMKDYPLWLGSFDGNSITSKSVIVYTGILDYEKDVMKCGWACYPDIYTLLGFIIHVFLPASFYTWFDRDSKGFFTPVSTFNVVADEVKKTSKNPNNDLITRMERAHAFLNSLWEYDEQITFEKSQKFTEDFNLMWDEGPYKKLFIRVFDNPDTIFEFIKNSIDCEFEEVIEEEISMSLKDLEFMCSNVLKEPLLNKLFINILNTKMPIMF